jgi:hypothetical protein
MAPIIVPRFSPEHPAENVRELTDLFLISKPADVPVEGFTIESDGRQVAAHAGPDHYQTALVLLYLMDKDGHPSFDLTPELQDIVRQYFGTEHVAAAGATVTGHEVLRALLGQKVRVHLTLRPGYRDCLSSGRTLEEIIRHGWERRETLTPASPEPFLRHALTEFFEEIRKGELTVARPGSTGHWPDQQWHDRVCELYDRLGLSG